ncbi:MAG: fatty acid desaturase [Okeania sp. SIO3H1]|nr:fatty acid desaturase [Okeania sp. SIO3H1]
MTVSIAESTNGNSEIRNEQLQLKDIVKSLPREVFLKDKWKTWTMVAVNIFMVVLGYWGLTITPWFLLPLLWVFTGTALTGFFVIGHDCGHRSFANRRWVNDLVGHLAFLPLIYPFHGWRIGHNYHHKHTNKMGEDNAWQPWYPEDYGNAGSFMQSVYRFMRGKFWWLGSVAHWAVVNFDWRKFEGKDSEDVKFSTLVVFGFSAIAFPLLIATVGLWGLVKFWLIPWLVYHFWMSTFTIVHHTVPEISFNPAEEWNEAEAQLFGTVHCDYPRWVEFLCHDINVHIPHHISTGIPSYNLRKAHKFLKDKWGDKLYETKFSWSLMKEITEKCHLYDKTKFYLTFKEYDAQKVSQ